MPTGIIKRLLGMCLHPSLSSSSSSSSGGVAAAADGSDAAASLADAAAAARSTSSPQEQLPGCRLLLAADAAGRLPLHIAALAGSAGTAGALATSMVSSQVRQG